MDRRIDWSSLWKKEDWWAVWVGFFILLMGIANFLPPLPKVNNWSELGKAFPTGISTIGWAAALLAILIFLTVWIIVLSRKSVTGYLRGFLAVFFLASIAIIVGRFAAFTKWGLETVLWALVLGLVIGNIWRIPDWLKTAIQTEFFIKIGLVLLGAEILFSTIVKGGAIGMGQALLVVLGVWFFAYWLARKMGMVRDFALVMASGLSICGVSAAIAAGGAVKANPRHTSYVISMVMLIAMPMLVLMPILARVIGLPPNVSGAWIGGSIDTTAAVAAAGTLVDPQVGLTTASLVKMAQNVLIGFAAFFMAIWTTFSAKSSQPGEKPSAAEIWYRFPKFILGFVLASVVFSLLVEPGLGAKTTGAILGVTKGYREWFFVLAFVCIGLDTRFKELIAVGGGKPAVAFIGGQLFNIAWALLIAWLLWSGVLFTPPI